MMILHQTEEKIPKRVNTPLLLILLSYVTVRDVRTIGREDER